MPFFPITHKNMCFEREFKTNKSGIYIGGKRFIHSQGDVRVGSLDPSDACFDEFNRGRLLFATRFLPYVDKEEGLNTTATNPYYK